MILVDPLLTPCPSSDPLPYRPHPYNWSTKDDCFLRTTAETQRDSSLCSRHRFDTDQVASDWVSGGTVRHICFVRRFFCNNRVLCWQRTCCGSVHTNGTREDIRRKKKCGITCLGSHCGHEAAENVLQGV